MTRHENSGEAVGCAICGGHHDAHTIWIVENTDGKFVASFSTHLLAHYFVEEGSGCYRHRAAIPAPCDHAKLIGELVEVIELFQRLKRRIMIDVGSCHSLRGPGASSEMRSDDRDMRDEIEAAYALAESLITRARQIGER